MFDEDEAAREDEGGCLQEGEGLYPQSSQWEAEQQEEEEEEVIRAPPVSAIPEKVRLSSALPFPSKFCSPSSFQDVVSLQVNKETSTGSSLPSQRCSVVRPKERRPDVRQQNPFMRGNTIIRSKTFSPGPQSQYICRVTAARCPQFGLALA